MDSKYYVSLEAAKLLKEKGYNEETDCTIDYSCAIWFGEYRDDYDFPFITKAEAMDWLESKGILVEAFYTSRQWFFSIIDFNVKQKTFADDFYPTRLQAEDSAIIKALELL